MSEYNKKVPRSQDWNYGGPKWKLSRSKIDLFMECPRCFYVDNKLGVARPRGPSFTLNIAVDALLKKEFDIHRTSQTPHPLMKSYGIDAIPFKHKELNSWRENFVGIQHNYDKTGFTVCGAIDDVWVDPKGNLIIVDYKATAKAGKMDSLDDTKWQTQYKRQMEVYQWLFRQNGFMVSNTGYFVYVNGRTDKEAFDSKLEFDVTLIPHVGDDSWVPKTLLKIHECLEDDRVPASKNECSQCTYGDLRGEALRKKAKNTVKETIEAAAETPVKIKKAVKKASKKIQEKIQEEKEGISTLFKL